MEFLFTADRERYRRMTTSELRESYMVDSLFVPGELTLCYTDIDRAIVGSAVPLKKPLRLPVHKELASDFFAQRREIGVINIGGAGTIRVDGETFNVDNRDSIYIGREKRRGCRITELVNAQWCRHAKLHVYLGHGWREPGIRRHGFHRYEDAPITVEMENSQCSCH